MMHVDLEAYTPDPEELIEDAARICYDSSDKVNKGSAARMIEHLVRSGHESVFEHASATFFVSGVSRALTHQLVRHRIASYSQRSQRYVKETEPDYVTPPSIENHIEYHGAEKYVGLKYKYYNFMSETWKFYNELLKAGIKAEDARFVLPNACCTQIYVTMNFRELRHFFKLRTNKHAQWEIRKMAKIMHGFCMKIAPNVFKDIVFEE